MEYWCCSEVAPQGLTDEENLLFFSLWQNKWNSKQDVEKIIRQEDRLHSLRYNWGSVMRRLVQRGIVISRETK
jgi:hypothetical protein